MDIKKGKCWWKWRSRYVNDFRLYYKKGAERKVIYDLKGVKVENEFLNGIYNDLANLIGMEATKTIFDEYRGQQITFPVEFYSKKFIHNQIVKEYNGFNVKQLATKYEYSERTIRRILKDHIDSGDNQ